MRRCVLALAVVAAAVGLVLSGCHPHASHRATPAPFSQTSGPWSPVPPPPTPDLSGYAEVPVGEYLVTDQYNTKYVSFRTPDGLMCSIKPPAGCDGALHGTPGPANEVALIASPTPGAELDLSGFRQTSKPDYEIPGDRPAKTLQPGHKVVYQDYQCATNTGGITICNHGPQDASWFVLSPEHSAIGPRPAGLPAQFPDPHDFVVGDDSYTVGSGGRNLFPLFTVASGLTCKILIFSGGSFGCDGPLPGAPNSENEIFVDFSAHNVGMRKNEPGVFKTPNYPGTIRQLPVGHRLDYTYETDTSCMAASDGGVACYAEKQNRFLGFVVSANSAWTFGG